MKVRGILYDLDGVLIKSGMAWYIVIQLARKRWGYPPPTYEHFLRTFGQGIEADREEFFPEQTAAEVNAIYDELFPSQIEAVELMDQAPNLLAQMRERGLRQAIVTNTPRPLAQEIIRRKKLDEHLDELAAAGEAPEKPAPDLIWLALRRLGLKREEVIFVGDSKSDAGAAAAAGVRLAGLGIAGDITISSLAELANHV